MYFYTLPNMAQEAPLRTCKVEVELLTEREQLNIKEGAVRVWVSSYVQSTGWEKLLHKKYLPDYDSLQPWAFGFCVDANNLYGGVMQNENSLSQILRYIPILHWLRYWTALMVAMSVTFGSGLKLSRNSSGLPPHHQKILLRMTG